MSDLIARGLDFTFLDGVINFDFPKNVNDYIHRSGRAGRLNSPGEVISFYYNKNMKVLEEIERAFKTNLPIELGESSHSLRKG